MKDMNPPKFSVFCMKKTITIHEKKKEIFVEKKYDKYHSNIFTWHWLTKCTFSTINRNSQAQKNL